jgi:holo-[acyl-carrier protein] synthase
MKVGIDIIEIERLNYQNQILLNYVLSDQEKKIFNAYSLSKQRQEFLAGRWAIKEAILKTLPFSLLLQYKIKKFADLSVEYNHDQQLKLNGNFGNFTLSISHNRSHAIGIAIQF